MNYQSNRPGSGSGGARGTGYGNPGKEIVLPDFSDPELLGTLAEKLARDIADGTDLSKSQVRNFYGEIKNIERIYESRGDKAAAWSELYPRIKLIRAKAVYNSTRKQGKIPSEYKQFLEKGIAKIGHEYETGIVAFKKFCQLFEAVVGYSSAYTTEK